MKSCAPKEELPQKLVARILNEPRICKVKKILLSAGSKSNISNTFDEAKASIKARKRKERQESISSLSQDRKVIRSNSEERPISEDKDNGMRRVSSSGDFPKTNTDAEKSKDVGRKHIYELSDKSFAYDDHEHDKRRSHERFSRSHTSRSRKYPNKRVKMRVQSKMKVRSENQECSRKSGVFCNVVSSTQTSDLKTESPNRPEKPSQLYESIQSYDRPQSPIHTPISPVFDFATLHEQVDCSEPLLSQSNKISETTETMPSQYIASNRLVSSPRNSIIAMHRVYCDPDIAQQNSSKMSPLEERLQKINKQINGCKKKILAYEAEFKLKTGQKPTQFDKLHDDKIRTLYAELSLLKKQQKQLSEMSSNHCSVMKVNISVDKLEKNVSLRDTVDEIQQKLTGKRELNNRNMSIEEMTAEQLIEEKVSTQKALLYLESVHGRPQSKEDRDIVRPFYERYRTLKRMVSKLSNTANSSELATIHENEAMHFVTPTSSSNETESETTEVPTTSSTDNTDKEAFEKVNLHSLSKPDLLKLVKIAIEEKKETRRRIKEFEITTQEKIGRMLTKDDKQPMAELYVAYKKIKSRLRLLEALVAKF